MAGVAVLLYPTGGWSGAGDHSDCRLPDVFDAVGTSPLSGNEELGVQNCVVVVS